MRVLLNALLTVCLLSKLGVTEEERFFEPPEAWSTHWLPGQSSVVFSLYGCPGDLDAVSRLISLMEKMGLGNGFDPGPSATMNNAALFAYCAEHNWPVVAYPPFGGEFQVKNGRAQLTDADEVALQVMDRNGVFLAIQLGEWGYYFHNLSSNEGWHRSVFGTDFETFKHVMKPAGLQGYDSKPRDRKACYEAVRDYFLTRHRAMRGRTISVTGHSHYEAYAAEWGTRVVGLELGENIAFTQSKIAFARGAARQWNKPWSIQVSPWFSGACTTNGPLTITRDGCGRGLNAGHSLSFYERMWLHSWFAGVALVTPENSISIFFEQSDPEWTLTEHGRKAADVFATMKAYDPGTPYTPVAIVLDHYAGYNAYKGRPWGILENTPGDLETRDLFQHQLFPGSDHIHTQSDRDNPEISYLRPTPYGEMFDVILSSARAETLTSYPVLLLVGDIDFDAQFICELFEAIRSGTQVLLHERHVRALNADWPRLKGTGAVEVLESWSNPETERPAAIANKRLAELRDTLLPVTVSGDPVQYQVNRVADGWVVELINNAGVIKKPNEPALISADAIAQVRLTPRIPVVSATVWRTEESLDIAPHIQISVPAGETRFVALKNRER